MADEAEEDIALARTWYAAHGAGEDRFLHALDAVLHFVAEHPNAAMRVRGRTRRFPLKGFPYLVFFAVYPKEILVHRVFHTSQDPVRRFRRR